MSAPETFDLFASERAGFGPLRGDVKSLDVMSVVARRKLAKPETWQCYSWEVVTGMENGLLVEGGIPHEARTNKEKWRGVDGDRVFITDAEMEAARVEWESETGICANCSGSKQQFAAWNKDYGYKYRTCVRCNGSGVPAPRGSSAPTGAEP